MLNLSLLAYIPIHSEERLQKLLIQPSPSIPNLDPHHEEETVSPSEMVYQSEWTLQQMSTSTMLESSTFRVWFGVPLS
jgi:hypothetical protein